MKAAGLLSLDLPPDFAVPDPSQAQSDDEPFADEAGAEFHTDFIGAEAGGEGA
jgi:segregation and condensation protein B